MGNNCLLQKKTTKKQQTSKPSIECSICSKFTTSFDALICQDKGTKKGKEEDNNENPRHQSDLNQ